MQVKTTKRLFNNKYQCKIVLVCPGASVFRSNRLAEAGEALKKTNLSNPLPYKNTIKNQEDLNYATKLLNAFTKMQDYELRVESPWLSFYTNNHKDIETLKKIDIYKVKYISLPDSSAPVEENTVLMPRMPFDFKVTLGKTSKENSAFVDWAEGNKKLKLTKSSKRELLRDRSWGGTYFYISGENNLLMAKMHLGPCINKVERIIKE